MMTIEALGYTSDLEQYRKENGLEQFEVGRVISEHKDRYEVQSSESVYDAELIGNMRFSASSRLDLPAVGDWVAFSPYDEGKALIHAIYPRKSLIERQAVGKFAQKQIIATNIDYALILQAVGQDFNPNRLERYLTICHAAQVTPIVVLSKVDLIGKDELMRIKKVVEGRTQGIAIIEVSNQNEDGYNALKDIIIEGKTYCLLGSSGVGKSTLLNSISGNEVMETSTISTSVNKGRHTTSHRELVMLDSGGMVIDNPGMREVGIADAEGGLEITFEVMEAFAQSCKFKDCTHVNEVGCAVLEAVESGEVDVEAYKNYHKLQREKMHYGSSVEEKRKKDKNFGKLIKSVKNARKNSKY